MGIDEYDSMTKSEFERYRPPGDIGRRRRVGQSEFVEQDVEIAIGGDIAMAELRMERALRAERFEASERWEFRSPPMRP